MTCRYRGRTAVTLSFLFLLMSISAGWSQAARTIKIVVPYAPGSGPDILGRLLAEQIGRANGQTIFVESRPGAGTVIGTEAVARAGSGRKHGPGRGAFVRHQSDLAKGEL